MNLTKTLLILCISIFIISCQFIGFANENSGTIFKIKVNSKKMSKGEITKLAVDVFKQRIDNFAIKNKVEVSADSAKTGEINVKVFGNSNIEAIKKILLFEADLALMKVESPPNPNLATYDTLSTAEKKVEELKNEKLKILEYKDKEEDKTKWIIVENPPIITGKDLRDASATNYGYNESDYQISFSIKPDGAKIFGDWTGKNIGNYMAVVLNDKAESVAFIQSQIFDQGQISGRFTKENAENLALILKSGHLPAKIELLEQKKFDDSK